MDWTQVLTIVGSNLVLFLWVRTESRADHRALESWTKEMISSIQSEMKDFHGRLERQDAEFKAHMMHQHEKKKVWVRDDE